MKTIFIKFIKKNLQLLIMSAVMFLLIFSLLYIIDEKTKHFHSSGESIKTSHLVVDGGGGGGNVGSAGAGVREYGGSNIKPVATNSQPFSQYDYLVNKKNIGKNKVEHIYTNYNIEYGTFNIINKIAELNYLFFSIILFLFSIFLLIISSNVWFKYKNNQLKHLLNEKFSHFAIKRQNLIKEQEILKENHSIFSNNLYNLNSIIDKIQKEIDEIDKKNNNYKTDISFFFLALILFSSYIYLLYLIKGLPLNFIIKEIINYPLQFASPFVLIAIFFSLISFVRFLLVQSSYNTKQMNKFSLFGIILTVIDLIACFITIYQFSL